MRKDIAEKWAEALKSGEYAQGKLALRYRPTTGSEDDQYCCLGVLCELAVQAGVISEPVLRNNGNYNYSGSASIITAYLPTTVCQWAGMKSESGLFDAGSSSLTALNDHGIPFATIADKILENVDEL